MDERTRELLTAEPLGLLVRMATPNSLAFLVQSGVSLSEVWFIGRLGGTSLAAIALVFPLLMLTQTLSGGAMGGAVASAIARALGSGEPQRAEQLLWQSLALAAGGALLLLVLFLAAGRPFLEALGGSGDALHAAVDYCLVLFSGGLFIWMMGVLSAVYRGMGNMKFPAAMMIVGACIQVPLSAGLILGIGLPQLGVVGAAVSAIVSAMVLSTVMLMKLGFGDTPVRLRLASLKLRRTGFADILRVALPASLSPVLTVTTILSLTAMAGRFGENALAGYGIGSRIEFLLIPLVFGIGASMTSLVGMSVGAGNIDRAERIGRLGGLSAGVLAGSIGLVLALFPDVWIPAFTANAEIHESARQYIRLVGPCFAFQGIGLSLYFASQGAGAMAWPVAALVMRVVVAVGGAGLLMSTSLGLEGIYVAAAFGMALYGVIMMLALRLGAWR